MTTEKALKKILSGIGSAAEHRRRADTISALYYKELAHIAMSAVRDPASVFSCSADRDEDDIRELLLTQNGICDAGLTGALFAKYYTELCSSRGIIPELADMFRHTVKTEPASAAYVTGGFADAAFDALREELAAVAHVTLRPYHAERAGSACDCVLDGKTDFAIIPLWNDRDGNLRSFYRMIGEFDLKILSVTTVPTDEGRTRFALCGAEANPLYSSPAYMEISLIGHDSIISDISDASRAHGHTVTEISTSPSEGGPLVRFTIRAGGDLRPTLLYLNLFHPAHTMIGLYCSTNER